MSANILSATSGELQQTGWNLPANLTYEQWSGAAEILNRVDNARQWWIGDWWNAGVEWGKGAEACEENNLNYQDCQDFGSVASAFVFSERSEKLSFNHHRVVMGVKGKTLRLRFLDWCIYDEHGNDRAKRKSIRELREAIRRYLDSQDWTEDEKARKAILESGGTVLLNMSKITVTDTDTGEQRDRVADEKLIEWAKFNGCHERIDRHSIWGNPFELGKDGDRNTVCDNYAKYLAMKPSLVKRLPELKGKALACWCHPERCHGETLLERMT